jgi:1,5-rhamnosyltransferase
MYFLGRDKGRAILLAELSKRAREYNLTTNFLILEDEKDKSVPVDGLRYTNEGIPYEENLQNVARCNCIVELLQKNAASPTFRLWEAICFNKKLLTNNCSIKESPFYDSRYVSTFSSIEDIDWEFVKNIAEPAFPDQNPFCEQIKPASLIRFIETSLDIRIHQ